jgi:hypothetical protein
MPYTPPTQRSPASSKPNSPILSRSQSYINDSPLIYPGAAPRPALPRSISSTAYLNKHRRSPSINQHQQNGNQSSTSPPQERGNKQRASPNGSLRQSPSPVNNLLIPTGAITTPPDSASDDEERGRQLGDLVELQEALQSIKQTREHSPVRNVDGAAAKPEPVAPKVTPPPRPLTPEARKISHSRSSSEIQLSSLAPDMAVASADNTSEDSDEEDDGLRIKPPLVRKKSGELVKPALRPSSRRRPSSMPGTPTFSKAVHFNDDIEQVRHFLQVDRPIAVSAGSSPVETYDSESDYPFDSDSGYPVPARKVEWDIKLSNFPRDSFERETLPVRVERIFLAADNKTLVGNVAVANIAFHKLVVARFTLDYWKTTSEVVAEYNNDVRKKQVNDGYDRFNFNIKLADQANLESKTLLLCVRYNVNGTEYWDNNNNMNYQVDFIKKAHPKSGMRSGKPLKPSVAIPRSRHSPGSGRPRSYPSAFEDDFSNGFDTKYQFGPSKVLLGDQPHNSIRLKNKANKSTLVDHGLRHGSQQGHLGFSNRYDFGASLTAALNTAQSALGDRSGIKMKEPSKDNGEIASKSAAPAVNAAGPTPDAISSEKPDLQSAEYNELIQKFCFVREPRPGTVA